MLLKENRGVLPNVIQRAEQQARLTVEGKEDNSPTDIRVVCRLTSICMHALDKVGTILYSEV